MSLQVLVVGRSSNEAEPILNFLNNEEIPHIFQEAGRDFDAIIPACYVGQYQTLGVEESLEKIKGYFHMTRVNFEKSL